MAVVGVGSLGQHHARIYAGLPEASLVGVVDRDPARAREIAARHGV
ncbi:MAG: Gfo/Idh/MocA family oxidoreductase, partial [Acidobacteriota bacterium]